MFFYSVIFGLFYFLKKITIMEFVKCLFPVTNGIYWYFTQYTIFYLLKPIIDNGLNYLDKNILRINLFFMFLLFTIFETLCYRFSLNNGYSFGDYLVGKDFFISYTSPLVVLSSVIYINLLKKIKYKKIS